MNILELKEKYAKAHEVYLKYKDINGTNNVEYSYLQEVVEILKSIDPTSTVIINNDNFLNYLGCDIIWATNNSVKTIDVKICQHCSENEILCDGWKHNNNEFFKATDVKINDYFLFRNCSKWILVPFSEIVRNIPKTEECFYLRRDLKRTTLKFILNINKIRKRVIDSDFTRLTKSN